MYNYVPHILVLLESTKSTVVQAQIAKSEYKIDYHLILALLSVPRLLWTIKICSKSSRLIVFKITVMHDEVPQRS